MERIVAQVSADIRAKYEKGQREHGGNLWMKPRMLENAIEEVLDLAVYLFTMREQIERGVDQRTCLRGDHEQTGPACSDAASPRTDDLVGHTAAYRSGD
jgi:hypothetical protein